MIKTNFPPVRRTSGSRPAPVSLVLAGCAVCALLPLHAQDTNDGFTAQQKPGIALVKPQPWSSPGNAVVTEFKGFTDRTVPNAPGAGYYEFDDGAGNKNQIQASRVVVLYIYPSISDIRNIETSDDRQKIQTRADSITSIETRFPATRAYINSYARQLADALQKYDGGQVEVDGQWIPRETYIRQKAQNLIGLLTDDVKHAKPVSSFDLENDARYIQLQALADEQPALHVEVTKISALYQKQVRTEKRAQMLAELGDPATTRNGAEVIVADLRKLQPGEDPAAMAYLESWDADVVRSVDVDKQLTSAQAVLEAAVVSIKPPTPNPSLPVTVVTQADSASRAASLYKASNPPAQLGVNYELATALSTAADGFSTLGNQFVLKQIYDAKATIDQVASVAKAIGPNTTAAAAAVEDYIARQIQEFKSLRDDGRLLIKNKKPVDAYAKFKAAYDVIQDPSLKQEMDKLKGSMPPDSP